MRQARRLLACLGLSIAIIALVLPIRTLADGPRRVVLIQVDAARADLLDQFLTDGTLSPNGGFATLSNTYHSAFQTVITPSLTTPNLTTLFQLVGIRQ